MRSCTKQTKGISAANRGMSLEKDLNDSNQYYLQSGARADP